MVMTGRLGRDPEEELLEAVRRLEQDIQELKVSSQYVDAKLFEYTSANASDLSGSLASNPGNNGLVLSINVTVSSTDGKSFISSFVPQLWIGGSSSPYNDTLASSYQVTYNAAVSSNPGVIVYYYVVAARSSVAASSFQFKANVYSTSPVTVSFARVS